MSPLDRRQFLRLLGAAGAAGATGPALAACSNPGPAAAALSPVRVGLIVPQSGANKFVGDELNAGFQLYLKLHHDQLAGRPVQVSTVDEGANADSGKAAVDRLIKDSVHVLSGVASSVVMSAIRDQVEAAQVPLLGAAASPATLGSVKFIWRTSYVNTDPSTALGQYIGSKTSQAAYVISDGTPAAQEQVGGFLAAFNGVLGHHELAAPPAQVTGGFAAALDTIRTANVRHVFAAFSADGAAAFLKAYRNAGLSAAVYAPGFLTEGTDALQKLGPAAMGLYTAMNYGPDLDNPANRTFAAQYQRIYGNMPTAYAMASYDAAAVLEKALGYAGPDLSPQSLNAALSAVGELDSPRGSWQFNQSRTPLQRWYLRQVRRDGQVVGNTVLGDLGMQG